MARAVLISVVLLILSGCSDELIDEPDAAPESPAPQGSPATSDLVINEISPRPTSGPDWVELLNRGDQSVDLCEFFLTDNLDRLDHYLPLGAAAPPDACAPVLIEPGDYYVIYADDDPGAGPDHAPFELARADEIHLVLIVGLAVDSLVYLHPNGSEGQSLARVPDGEGLFFVSEESLGAANPEVE